MHYSFCTSSVTFVCSTLCILTLLCLPVRAQFQLTKPEITSTLNPVGSGARAMGMGGAFIAVADDATAASWNPAGLTQLKRPEISFVVSYSHRRDDLSVKNHPETSGIQKTWSTDLNYASIAYPFELFERNMTLSLNYQRLYEFDRDIKTNINSMTVIPTPRLFEQKVKFRQRGKLCALSPAYAIDITPNFSLGCTFNIWTDKLFWSNGWESDTTIDAKIYRNPRRNSKGLLTFKETSRDHDRYSGFSGFNMNLGFMWNINRFVTIGGVIKTPFTGDMDHERVETKKTIQLNATGRIVRAKTRLDENVHMEMPLSYGLGVALRFSDRFTLSLDVYRTEWDHFKLEDGRGNRINAVTGKPSHESSSRETHQVRLGSEYLFIFPKTVVPLRCGLFYDPAPSEKNPDDFWGFSLGTGISLGDVIFDCAYQFRYGNNVEGDLLNLPSTSADVTQHLFMASVIYHF